MGTVAYPVRTPGTVNPKLRCLTQNRSRPLKQSSHRPQLAARKVMPTRSPRVQPSTPAPMASTRPMPSWPRISGVSGNFSSPDTKMSEWQRPQASIFTRTSPVPGSRMGTGITCTGVRGAATSAASV